MSETTAVPLSNDTIFDILCRTPFRSVCRFRCVSRGWPDLISAPDFAAAHRSRHGPLLVDTGYFRQEKPAAGRDMRLMDMEGNVIRVIRVVGGFGITCSSSLDDLIAVSRGPSNGIHVVDPATGEVLLTCPPMEVKTLEVHPFIAMARYEIYGFGRAISSDEYKVVRIAKDKRTCEVLTLGDDPSSAWRRTLPPPISVPTDVGSPVAVNGIMYFLADETRETLLCFDIESEQWKANMIKGPRKGNPLEMRRKTAAICISELNGALCMVIAEKQDSRSTNIWTLDDSGKINWIKAYSIPMTPYTSRYMPLMVMPGGGKLLLQCHGPAQSVILQIYDPRTNTSTHVMKAPKQLGDRIAICNFRFHRRVSANN
ncbi:hypothetical protein CFC21_045939 [Triticum aestivum]|uniref:F-box domain-containing protein n=2 Tax=Triticum aestivum TaxID=4565 RepID=A0A3B6GR74_WHEAT|nr:hypothetical protein CFC21_045939 [Triticum aestivum]